MRFEGPEQRVLERHIRHRRMGRPPLPVVPVASGRQRLSRGARRQPVLRLVALLEVVRRPGAAHLGRHPAGIHPVGRDVRPQPRHCGHQRRDQELRIRVAGSDAAAIPIEAVQARAPAGGVCLVAVERGGNMSSPQSWDRLIVSLATDRDREAFASLFAHFAPRLKTFMLRQGMDKAGAEELAQEAMLAVWRKADLYDPQTASAAAWIFAIARNLRIDALRRERGGWMGGNFEVEAEFQVDDSPLPDQRLADSQSQERVRAALGRLSADQLQVIELSYYEEKAHGDIANTLGIPLGTVKSRLRLAMGRLRELLREPS